MNTNKSSNIADINMANQGQEKIDWVKDHMPVLSLIEKRFIDEKPLSGLKISISIHLEAKTAYFAHVLRSGGADVFVTGSNPLSTQDDVAAALVRSGFTVNAINGVTKSEYKKHLENTLICEPHIIVDDGGDLLEMLHESRNDLAKNIIGGCEETTTGVRRMVARSRQNILYFPMIAVNNAKSKRLFDNYYGTGQSVWDAILNTTNLLIAGKTVVVAGYGYCGKGIAKNAKGLGASVIVTEVDVHAALEAVLDGNRVMDMKTAAELGDVFVTSTGSNAVISMDHFSKMKNGAILSNAGHFDVEIDIKSLNEHAVKIQREKPGITKYILADGKYLYVLGEGRLVNLAVGNGHPAEIMDMSFSLQSLCVEYLTKHGYNLPRTEVIEVPRNLDIEVAKQKLNSMNVTYDRLTKQQIQYLAEI